MPTEIGAALRNGDAVRSVSIMRICRSRTHSPYAIPVIFKRILSFLLSDTPYSRFSHSYSKSVSWQRVHRASLV